jgi:hypothetical protein|tara:strand:- start:106 stop:1179 length:1074 start_codon:yes stop_codon:yes gene_type:complete
MKGAPGYRTLATGTVLGNRSDMKHQDIPKAQRLDYSRDLSDSPKWIVATPFFALGFVFSLWYLTAYYGGDAYHYTNFYNSLYELPHEHWANFQRLHLGAAEPLYRYIIALGAYTGLDRTLYLSVWNGAFVGIIGYILIKHRCSALFCTLVLTNVYLVTLLGSAERLKFAYFFLILAFAVENRTVKFALGALSLFTHTQAAVQFVSALNFYILDNLKKIASTPAKGFLLLVGATAAVSLVFYLFFFAVGQSIEAKSEFYLSESEGLAEAIQWGLLLFAGLAIFDKRLAYFVAMLPMGVLTVLFGNRVNVATLALFAGLAILQRKTNNPIVLAVMAYMSFKTISFLFNVVEFGDGFVRA